MIEEFALIYVNYIEPLGRAFIVLMVILTIMWLLIVISDAKKGQELITQVFQMLWKGLVAICVGFAKGLLWFLRNLYHLLHEIYRSIYEFLFKNA